MSTISGLSKFPFGGGVAAARQIPSHLGCAPDHTTHINPFVGTMWSSLMLQQVVSMHTKVSWTVNLWTCQITQQHLLMLTGLLVTNGAISPNLHSPNSDATLSWQTQASLDKTFLSHMHSVFLLIMALRQKFHNRMSTTKPLTLTQVQILILSYITVQHIP
jgi:hypothetical protein